MPSKLNKTQLTTLLQEKEAQYKTLKADSTLLYEKYTTLKQEHNTLKTNHASLTKHATKQNTELTALRNQQAPVPQQAYTLIINNTYQYDFPNKEACHSWVKNKLHSYKLLHIITTPTCKVVFILAVSKAKASTK